MTTNFKTIDEYIALQPEKVILILEEIRETIRNVIPEAEETISYQIPTFKYHGNLVHFAAYKNHIGFYPGHSAVEAFNDYITNFATSKGTIQFPIDEPIPLDLISKITAFRVKQNLEKKKK
ncbi:DUF1801 domain-containing protein [Flavobacterium sp.]|uniref:iron chaperone n=1 Tax=Flavobacterium sp. TaxID=239 RepID=UPI000EC80A84|nr:DUF1801 domain-containing protein [Flavobacterium sp.]HCQ13411.1 hypothetical protein [Flavobacterium sp.]